MTKQNIGLSELIEKVKADLLKSPQDKTAPFLFVDSVELELQVVIKKDANTGLEVDVIGIGGAKIGADVGQQNIQKVKVSLSPVFTKEEMREAFKNLKPEDYISSYNQSRKATIKNPSATEGRGGF